jgi:hypothetical protein
MPRRTHHRLRAALVAWSLVQGSIPSQAAQICERPAKRGTKARLSGTACRANEKSILDTGQVTTQGTRVGALETSLGVTCAGDPSRKLLVDTSGRLALLGYASFFGGACRSLDADPTACAGAFSASSLSGPSACVHLRGKCLPCDPVLAAAGVCTNPCQPRVACADASRTTVVEDCDAIGTVTACEQAWTATLGFTRSATVSLTGASCYWTGSACKDCADLTTTACTNTCVRTEDRLQCRDTTRSQLSRCEDHDGNAQSCATAFEVGQYGTTACWIDGPKCKPCTPLSEIAGRCTNPC